MRWPWISRAEHVKVTNAWEVIRADHAEQLRQAQQDGRQVEAMLAECLVREAQLMLRLEAADRERKALLDRIMKMLGSPAIYEEEEVISAVMKAVVEPAPAEPAEPPRMTVDGLKDAYRSELRKGHVDVAKCRVRV